MQKMLYLCRVKHELLANTIIFIAMKRTTKLFSIAIACAMIVALNACRRANVNLNDIDTSATIETSLSLPLGTVSIKLGDIIGDSTIQGVSVDEHGQYIFSDTIQMQNDLTLIDLNKLKASGTYTFDFAQEVLNRYPQYANMEIPAGKKLDITFPIGISIANIKEDMDSIRLDSLVVDVLRFYTSVTPKDLAISQHDIKVIEVSFLNGFRCSSGNTVEAPISKYGLGTEMPIELNDVHIVLMKDPTATPSAENIVDSLMLNVRIAIETSSNLILQESSALQFSARVDKLDFDAVFGYVKMPNLLQDSILNRPIESFWEGWKAFDGTILPLNKPSIFFTIEHGFSVPLAATVNALNVSSKAGEYRHATFDGAKSKTFHFPSKIAMDAPYDATTIDSIRIDYHESNGNIDELLTIHPDYVSYDYQIGIDTTSEQQQFRITNNTHLNMNLKIHMPFEFKNNVHFAYCDTMRDINLTAFQLDSLLAEVEFVEDIEKAELKLYLTIENWIPFNIEALVTFMNEDGTAVQLSSMEADKLELRLQQPKTIVDGFVTEASTNQIILNVTQNDFEKIASVKSIEIQAKLKENNTVVKLTPEAAVNIKAGVTADLKAIVNINSNN